jgi:hypothetical protein
MHIESTARHFIPPVLATIALVAGIVLKTQKALLGVFTITLVLAVQVQAQSFLTNGPVAYPTPVIFDCDIGSDIGDNSAASMIIVAHIMGLCNVEAMTCCVAPGYIYDGVPILSPPSYSENNMTQVAGAGFLEQLCMFYGVYPEFGFGNTTNLAQSQQLQQWTDPLATTTYIQTCGAVSNSYFSLKFATNYPPAYKVMRTVLANRKAVTLLITGQLNNYAQLLWSPADEISPLTGYQLVSNNASRVVAMAGQYPNGREYNICSLGMPAKYAISNTPPNVPITFAGWELAQNPGGTFRILDLPHPWIDYLNHTNPVYMVYTNLYPAGQGRAAWDSITALYAICNVKSNSWFQRVQGSNFVDCVNPPGGYNYFTPGTGPGYKDFYLTIDPTNEATISTVLNRFITAQPPFAAPEVGAGPSITTQPSSQVVWLGGPISVSVTAEGTVGLSYQWRLNGTNLAGATDSIYTRSNAQFGDAGAYTVFLTDIYGSGTSSDAVLQVLPPNAPSLRIDNELAVASVSAKGSAQLTISGGFTNGFIFYTLDGTIPTTNSPFYSGPVTLNNSAIVQAMSLSDDFAQSAFAPAVTVQIIPFYNLQTSVVGGGTISVSPTNAPYASNTVVVLTANAATNWGFDHWTGDATGSENPLSLSINGPRTVQAVFVNTAYPLTVTTPGGGSVTVDGHVISPATFYSAGRVVTLTATASDGWGFLGWQGDASGTNNPLSVTISQTNNVQGVFGTDVGTNTVGDGGIVLSQPNPIPFGTTLTASAVPDTGNYFVAWSEAASGTNAPTTIEVTSANPTVGALFTNLPEGKYSLAVVVMGDGSVAISPHNNYYDPGDSVTLSASTTNAGTQFYGWRGDASGTNNPLVVVVSTNTIVQANFGALFAVDVSPQHLIVLAGSNAVLNANATGLAPLSYQWLKGSVSLDEATNASYTITNAQPADEGSYSVIVSTACNSATSGVVTVTVVFPSPSITQQPQNWTVAAGTVLDLSVSASGAEPLNYQWLNSSGSIMGATNATYTLNPVQTNNADSYFVVVANPWGSVTSDVATVTVYVPVGITTQPASQVVPAWSTVSFNVAAGGYPAPSYQWTFNGTNLPGATSQTLTITNVLLPNMGDYAVLVENGYSSQLSDPATLSMSPSITSPFRGATTIWGRSAVLLVGAIGSGELAYQWYKHGVAVAGATDATLNFASVQFTDGGLYSVVVSNPFGTITNEAAQVVVNPAGVSLGFSPTLAINGVPGYSYVIQSSTNLTDTNAWVTLTNLTLTQPVELWVDTSVDASSPFNSGHYYRVLLGQ